MFPSDQHDYVKITDLLGMLNEEKLVCSFMLSVFSCHALELDVKRFSVKITSLHHLHGVFDHIMLSAFSQDQNTIGTP